MEQNTQTWANTTKNIFIAVMISSIGTVIANLLSGISSLVDAGPMIARSGAINPFMIGISLMKVAVATGYILYLVWLNNLRNFVAEKDNIAVRQISNATLLIIIAFLTGMFYIPIWLDALLSFVANIIMLVGFNTLRKSEFMSEKARHGFEQLFKAMLLSIIACGMMILFGWIHAISPFIKIVSGIIAAVGFVLVMTGWYTVKNAPEPLL